MTPDLLALATAALLLVIVTALARSCRVGPSEQLARAAKPTTHRHGAPK